jgi:rubrerythrin
MMAEYIERKRLLRKFNVDDMMNVNGTLISLRDAREVISSFPAADVAPVRHGRWQYNTDFYVWCCSECGKNPTKGTGVVTTAEKLPAYCPHCGAKMEGAE